ncbi:MAG: EamA family transporter, partial [Actinobacteria bacterium]|nr:EamA family transporter [Actinomycetota bacterium]
MRTKHPVLGVIFATAGVILFGLNASTSKVIMQSGITPEEIVIFRSIATAIGAAIALAFTKPQAFRIQRTEWRNLVLFGVFGVALMQWAYSNAVKNLPIGIALLIEYTAIVIVPLVSLWLFKEKVLPRLWVAIAMVLFGLVVVSRIWAGGLNPVGLMFAVAAAIFLSFYFLMGEHTMKNRDALSTLFYSMSISALFWLLVSPWWEFDTSALTSSISLTGNLSQFEAPLWLLLIWLGVFGSFLPMLFSFLALTHLSATSVGVISTGETVLAFFFAWAWLNE